jgi:hypothetical protein
VTTHIDILDVADVRADHDAEAYVITHDDGSTSALPFDLCMERIERYELNLESPASSMPRGAMTTFTYLRGLVAALSLRYDQTGEQAVAELSPQLMGLEGWVVMVEDEDGDMPREFRVGKSDGFLPYHVEATETERPARREYWRVDPLFPGPSPSRGW